MSMGEEQAGTQDLAAQEDPRARTAWKTARKTASKGEGPLGALKSNSKTVVHLHSYPIPPRVSGEGASPVFSLQSSSRGWEPRPDAWVENASLPSRGTHYEAGWVVRPTTPTLVVGRAAAGSAAGLRDPLGPGGRTLGPPQNTILDFPRSKLGRRPILDPYQHRIWGEARGQLCLRRAGNRVSCQNRCWGLRCVVNHLTTRQADWGRPTYPQPSPFLLQLVLWDPQLMENGRRQPKKRGQSSVSAHPNCPQPPLSSWRLRKSFHRALPVIRAAVDQSSPYPSLHLLVRTRPTASKFSSPHRTVSAPRGRSPAALHLRKAQVARLAPGAHGSRTSL